ncbi:MAG: TIGR01777 family oxidoreductase [Syntrophobacteraceae bacterium]|nr:TIGR01777 family oxidoreductase [Syntrophobacteraceae bacterium]
MKIFVTGGTGFVGRYVTGKLAKAGREILILSRSAPKAKEVVPWAQIVEGDPRKRGDWQQRVAECDAVINLAGSSIFTVWTDSARKSILDSRILSTRNLVDALSGAGQEKILINGSAVGYYGSRLDDELLDEDAPHGSEFMSEVCVKWEEEARKAVPAGVRVALCRFGIVLGRGGGALSMMLPAFRYLLGSSIGSGKQWMSWIHLDDLVAIFSLLLEDFSLSGPINCVAPNPVRNAEFARVLSRTLGRPILLPGVPSFALNMLLGEFADVVVKGQRVIPQKLMEKGFSFRFPTLSQALEDLAG